MMERNGWVGYVFVGDNIDKNVKPRFQRYENKGQSLYTFFMAMQFEIA